MKKVQKILLSISLALAVSGCSSETEKTTKSQAPVVKLDLDSKAAIKKEKPNMVTLRGTVRYKNLEGGFWGFDGSDGKKYMPQGISKDLLVDGMVVEVTGIIEDTNEVMTLQQYGKTLKVKESIMIDNSNARALNSY